MTALAQAVRPRALRSPRSALATDVTLVLLGSVAIALAAQLSVRLPFTPVPITAQTLAVLLVGASLGAVRGGASVLLYLAEGAVGLPVFAEGKSGVLFLTSRDPLHASGGYLWGFVAAAVVAGFLAQRRWDRTWRGALAAMFVGNLLIYVFGVPWLASAVRVSGEQALALGVYPFVIGDVVKLVLAASVLPTAWRLVGHNGGPGRLPRL